VPDISRHGMDDNTNTGGTYDFSALNENVQGSRIYAAFLRTTNSVLSAAIR
jgi:hypothetical protein